ncbi:hypothetical protein Tco_0076041, partial [Tanacetum coccineum]
AGIDHGREGRSLADIVAYNPSAEVDFNSFLQELREVDFPLLAELKSHKDASIEDIMNLLRLKGPLADAPKWIRANIAAERLALLGVWTPLSEPLSVQNLISAASTSASIPAATGTTTALSTTFASARSIPPITVEDYEIIHSDGQENSHGNVATVEFKKEDLDTTPKHDLLN